MANLCGFFSPKWLLFVLGTIYCLSGYYIICLNGYYLFGLVWLIDKNILILYECMLHASPANHFWKWVCKFICIYARISLLYKNIHTCDIFENSFKMVYVMSWQRSRVLSLTKFYSPFSLTFQVIQRFFVKSSALNEVSSLAVSVILFRP